MAVITQTMSDHLSLLFRELTAFIVDADGRTVSSAAPAAIVFKGSTYRPEIPSSGMVITEGPTAWPLELRLYKVGFGLVFTMLVEGILVRGDVVVVRTS